MLYAALSPAVFLKASRDFLKRIYYPVKIALRKQVIRAQKIERLTHFPAPICLLRLDCSRKQY